MNLEELGGSKPRNNPANVKDVIFYKSEGPYTTKTNSSLFVCFALPSLNTGNLEFIEELAIPHGIDENTFLSADKNEESKLIEATKMIYPEFNYQISGLRGYFQLGMNGGVAGREFHRIRKEITFLIDGKLNAKLEDVYGKKMEISLGIGDGLFIPPFIIHSFEIIEKSIMFSLANTLFVFNHSGKKINVTDTYSEKDFEKLKRKYSA
jgi:hypothetical protein